MVYYESQSTDMDILRPVTLRFAPLLRIDLSGRLADQLPVRIEFVGTAMRVEAPSSSPSPSSSHERLRTSPGAGTVLVPRRWRRGKDGGGGGGAMGSEGGDSNAGDEGGGIAPSFSPAVFPSSRRRKRKKKISVLLLLAGSPPSWRAWLGLRALLLVSFFQLALELRAEVFGMPPTIIPSSSSSFSPPLPSPPAMFLPSSSPPVDAGGAQPQPQGSGGNCPSAYYSCHNGNCIYFRLRCNGNDECGDNSDELQCAGCYEGAFYCVEELFCIVPSRRCDGKNDCRDGSDERGCPSCQGGGFLCTNRMCVRSTLRCDGKDDCGDGSDEYGCPLKVNNQSLPGKNGDVDATRPEGITQRPYASGGTGGAGEEVGGTVGRGPVMEEANAGTKGGGGGGRVSRALVAGVTLGCILFLAGIVGFLTFCYVQQRRRTRRSFATSSEAVAAASSCPPIISSSAPIANPTAAVVASRGGPASALSSPISTSSPPLSASARRTPRAHRQHSRSPSPINPNELWKSPNASMSASPTSRPAAIHPRAVGGREVGPSGNHSHHHHDRQRQHWNRSGTVYKEKHRYSGVFAAARGGGGASVVGSPGEIPHSPEPQMSDGSLSEEVACLLFTLDQLKLATGFFDSTNLLGKGRFGNTYKGVLPDGSQIAVKRLTFRDGLRNGRAFIKQVETLGMGNDSCLVKLWGCCVEESERMLVYEYVPNGNLGDYLGRDCGAAKSNCKEWGSGGGGGGGNAGDGSTGGDGNGGENAGDWCIGDGNGGENAGDCGIGGGRIGANSNDGGSMGRGDGNGGSGGGGGGGNGGENNGGVSSWIRERKEKKRTSSGGLGGTVTWSSRLEVALSVAKAVKCLHQLQAAGPYGIVHGALKAGNVLMDENNNFKLVDYGFPLLAQEGCELGVLFRSLHDTEYLAPDYASTGRVDRGTDVYGLGILILEILSGRRACERTASRPDGQGNIITWARDVLQSDNFTRILDGRIASSSFNYDSVGRVAEIAVMCCEPYAANRPSLQSVIAELSSALERCC
ncbi:hypothetical protein CBR_g70718 [Chara braunii]|uniref:Protein kinase domain-containing protein n=1 Tax=Chara braunii TaxID=69332 RepID=A0A388K9X0_CHABU|nr:hypothetical protein CBR_g70718 [Chara braunii]|eukprot:GBG66840.1 hypothetical protein CBR_g70718 [Chara braunii]